MAAKMPTMGSRQKIHGSNKSDITLEKLPCREVEQINSPHHGKNGGKSEGDFAGSKDLCRKPENVGVSGEGETSLSSAISEKPFLNLQYDPVSSRRSGARTAIDRVENETARAKGKAHAVSASEHNAPGPCSFFTDFFELRIALTLCEKIIVEETIRECADWLLDQASGGLFPSPPERLCLHAALTGGSDWVQSIW